MKFAPHDYQAYAIDYIETLKKYTNFVGIQNGKYTGFARIYVLSAEIVNYTDNKINLSSYFMDTNYYNIVSNYVK